MNEVINDTISLECHICEDKFVNNNHPYYSYLVLYIFIIFTNWSLWVTKLFLFSVVRRRNI